MEGMKAVSKSVSLPEALWETIEAHAPTTPGRDRSGYIRNLVEDDLKRNGPLAAEAATKAELIGYAAQVGFEKALAAVKRIPRRAA
jgi:metal-responsive CopG/Arc/MetJ family transcriptional regulator